MASLQPNGSYASLYKPHYLVHTNRDGQADIEWCWCFLVGWNGVALLRSNNPDNVIQIWNDVSSPWGCGAWLEDSMFPAPMGDSPLAAASIAVKEMLPILLALCYIGSQLAGLYSLQLPLR